MVRVLTSFTALIILLSIPLLRWIYNKDAEEVEKLRQGATAALESIYTRSTDVRFVFVASKAEIVEEDEVIRKSSDNGMLTTYELTRICRNSCGEYFWLHFTRDCQLGSEPKTVVKHMDHSVAKVALKKKYVAPTYPSLKVSSRPNRTVP